MSFVAWKPRPADDLRLQGWAPEAGNLVAMSERAGFRGIVRALVGLSGLLLAGAGLAGALVFRGDVVGGDNLRRFFDSPASLGYAVQCMLIAGFAVSVFSMLASPPNRLNVPGLVGLLLTFAATAVAGYVHVPSAPAQVDCGILPEWIFLMQVFLIFAFLPLDRLFARQNERKDIVRAHDGAARLTLYGWRKDLLYLLIILILPQLALLLLFAWLPASWTFPEQMLGGHHLPALMMRWMNVRRAVAEQPLLLQVIEILLLTDTFFYVLHRLSHEVPLLWRFHAVHHAPHRLNWVAGSIQNAFDAVWLRSVPFIPIFVLGFGLLAGQISLLFYLAMQPLQHLDVRWDGGILKHLLVLPQFHHWHHVTDANGRAVNFAIVFPWLDRLFGTWSLPSRVWPRDYGIRGESDVAAGAFLPAFVAGRRPPAREGS